MRSLWGVVGEALAGNLEAVEEQAGAVDVELVSGEAGDDFAECVLEGSLAGGSDELEASAGASGVGVGDGFAVGVVVVAVGFAA